MYTFVHQTLTLGYKSSLSPALLICKYSIKRLMSTSTNTSATTATKTNLGIIGVPFSKGQSKAGVEKAPDVLRQHGLVQLLENASGGNLLINDFGNLKYTPDLDNMQQFRNMKNYGDFMGCNKALIKKVQQMLEDNQQFLTIGGDHAIGFGSIAGHLLHTPNLSLIWIDAHADINLHTTSSSGNIHGMPVSLLLKELRSFWKNAHLDEIAPVCLPADQLIYIGLRDIDPYEAYILKRLGIRAYAMDSIDKYGIAKIMEMTLDALRPQNKLHISFDVDALDSVVAPSTGTVVPGGLTLREGITIAETLHETHRIQGIDLVELNPSLGSEHEAKTTITSSLEVLKCFYGYKRSGSFDNIKTDLFHV